MTSTALPESGTSARFELLDPAPADVWDRVCDASPAATFFHTRAWSEALARTYPFLRVATRAFRFESGVTAVLPLIQRSWLGGLFRSYGSLTLGVYGGPVADAELSQAQVEAMLGSVLDWRVAKLSVTGNPYASWRMPASFGGTSVLTQAIDLTPGFDRVFERFARGNKSNVHKAQRSGLEVSLANGVDDYRAYYAAYEDSMRRWGERTQIRYPLDLFLALRDLGGDNARLWLVRKDGEVAGGALVLYHNRHAVYWHGAFVEAYFEHRPSNLVHFEAIRDACERGYAWYDFNPSGAEDGVVRFKDSFHPERLSFTEAVVAGHPAYLAAARLRTASKRLLGRREL